MLHTFTLQPAPDCADMGTLSVTWDDATGEVVGQGAHHIEAMLSLGAAPWRPAGLGTLPLDRAALRTREGLALALGSYWVLPDDLAKDYPQPDPDGLPAMSHQRPDGVLVPGRDMVEF